MARKSRLVWHYLKPLAGGLALATVLSMVLGAVGAAISAMIGPCLQVLSAPPGKILVFRELLNDRVGAVAEMLAGAPGLEASALLARLPLWLALLAVVKAGVGAAQWFLFERAGELASLAARDELAQAYLKLSPEARRRAEARTVEGNLASAITNDVRLMREYIVHFYGGLPRELIEVVFYSAMMFALSPKLTAIFFVGVLPAGAVGARIGRKLRRRAARALSDYSDLSEWLQQRLLGVETIKHYRTEPIEIAKMEQLSASLYDRFLRAARVKARTSPSLEALAVVALVVVLGVALYDVSTGKASGSVQFSFLSTLAMMTQAAGKLGRYLNSNREGAAAVDRLEAVLSYLRPVAQEHVALPATQGTPRVICREVMARYEGAPHPALNGVSCELAGGKVYCFAGPSGAGKSTLFNLILGLVKPETGEVRLEAPGGSAQPVCYMPQKVLLAPDSVAANVAYPHTSWDAARVRDALAKVEMTAVVDALSRGAETVVGDGGAGLSGGQAQRILLARLWYHRAPIALVDEGTSALDPEVERTVHDLLRQLAASGSVVVTIAHRPASAEIADELLLLEAGKLVARGAPKDVMRSAEYKRVLH